MKRVRHQDVQSATFGLESIPSEILSFVLTLAYPCVKFRPIELEKVARLRKTCRWLCQVIDREILATIEDSGVMEWHRLSDESIHLFPSIRRIVLRSPFLERKRGSTIIRGATEASVVVFDAVLSDDLSIGLLDEMKADVLLDSLHRVETVHFVCRIVPPVIIERCPRVRKMRFFMTRELNESHIASMKNLTHLYLSGCSFTRGWDHSVFATLENLISLVIDNGIGRCDLHGKYEMGRLSPEITRRMTNLRSLVLFDVDFFDGPSIALLPHLESLSITRTPYGPRHFHITNGHLSSMKTLVSASFGNMCDLTMACLEGSSKTLRRLETRPMGKENFFRSVIHESLVDYLASEFPLLDHICSTQLGFSNLGERVREKRRILSTQ